MSWTVNSDHWLNSQQKRKLTCWWNKKNLYAITSTFILALTRKGLHPLICAKHSKRLLWIHTRTMLSWTHASLKIKTESNQINMFLINKILQEHKNSFFMDSTIKSKTKIMVNSKNYLKGMEFFLSSVQKQFKDVTTSTALRDYLMTNSNSLECS